MYRCLLLSHNFQQFGPQELRNVPFSCKTSEVDVIKDKKYIVCRNFLFDHYIFGRSKVNWAFPQIRRSDGLPNDMRRRLLPEFNFSPLWRVQTLFQSTALFNPSEMFLFWIWKEYFSKGKTISSPATVEHFS